MCQKRERCTVLLMAAGSGGSGLRMGGETRKQYIDVKGRPLFTYALETFDQSDIVTDIMIVVPEGDQEYCREIVETCGLAGKVRKIVAGGRERCDDDTMERLLDEVRISKACIAAVPTKDTVKIADQNGFVAQTPNRKDVWLVQTPQVFDFELIKKAHEEMVEQYDELLKKGVIITDDAMVAETFTGYRVKLVMASYRNIKVTTPEDMDTVAAYMKGWQ